jgi:hypothetical protein
MAWKNSKNRYGASFLFSKSPIWLLRNTIGVKAGNPNKKRKLKKPFWSSSELDLGIFYWKLISKWEFFYSYYYLFYFFSV